jgi:hypothetical protein
LRRPVETARENGPVPSEKEQNPFTKFVERDNGTPPTWREEARCVIFAQIQSPESLFWIFGPPTMMLLVGASLIWAVRGFWA